MLKNKNLLSSILPIHRATILILICILAFTVRLFSVFRYESVIHEFDPYFNFRTTKKLIEDGFYEWWNWFDTASWYPLGRVVGQTLYPGLMLTAFMAHKLLKFFSFPCSITNVCVFTAPVCSGATALASYCFTDECSGGNKTAALLAALFTALSPAYMSRSVAGSFDNEAVAIFALIFVFYAYVRSLNCGRLSPIIFACFAYLYMVASWGGYVFVTNTIAIHMLYLVVLQKCTLCNYVSYSVFYIIGTLFCLNIPFVNFQALSSSEHFSSHIVFILVQLTMIAKFLSFVFPAKKLQFLLRSLFIIAAVLLGTVWLLLARAGITRWAGRSMSILNPTYASRFIPIIASVSEHQPTLWFKYIFDLHFKALLIPIGFWLMLYQPTEKSLFLGVYGALATYFSNAMIRLLLILSPAACALSGIGLQYLISGFLPAFSKKEKNNEELEHTKSSKSVDSNDTNKLILGIIISAFLFYGCVQFIMHGVCVAALAYSNPSIVTSTWVNNRRIYYDDFREAYSWMGHNTHPDSRLMSWWDYGYQSAAMSNRTVIVDNNTWNTTHIATVGLIFASTEENAYPKLLAFDVDYVFVLFGGASSYSSDDINKAYWMIKIAGDVYPELKISDYYSSTSKKLHESLLYQLSYNNFYASYTQGKDTVRNTMAPITAPLQHLREAYTSENYLIRIYEVMPPDPLRASRKATGIHEI